MGAGGENQAHNFYYCLSAAEQVLPLLSVGKGVPCFAQYNLFDLLRNGINRSQWKKKIISVTGVSIIEGTVEVLWSQSLEDFLR